MKFHLAINLERGHDKIDMRSVRDHTLDMVKKADKAGFDIVWAAEHHALEMTIAPNPFQLLTWWSENTTEIRLGCGVANAAYWHPIKLAGEAAMLDLLSDGRLELGLGSGAYQREFDRMKPGLKQSDSWRYMQEMLPLLRRLWQGDVAHDGEFWSFPTATSCPKPLQEEVPFWVAARSPITFDYAVANDCNILSWPLSLPFSEIEKYRSQLDDAIEKAGGTWYRRFAIMRHTCVYENQEDQAICLSELRHTLGQFGNLMMQKGAVINGFPDPQALENLEGNARTDPTMLEENLMLGSPQTVIHKLKAYRDLGVDDFIYYASLGLNHGLQKRSMELFINEVMPVFRHLK